MEMFNACLLSLFIHSYFQQISVFSQQEQGSILVAIVIWTALLEMESFNMGMII